MSPIISGGSSSGGGSSFDGGTIGLEVTADITLVNAVPALWTFDQLFSDTADVTLGLDTQTLTFHATGFYQVWYSLAIKASATTVKSQVQSFIDSSDPLDWIGQTSFGELELHLNGATSLLDYVVTFMTPPIALAANSTMVFGATALEAAGSVGSSIVTSNTFASIVRIA